MPHLASDCFPKFSQITITIDDIIALCGRRQALYYNAIDAAIAGVADWRLEEARRQPDPGEPGWGFEIGTCVNRSCLAGPSHSGAIFPQKTCNRVAIDIGGR
jgi:hypothetical protein